MSVNESPGTEKFGSPIRPVSFPEVVQRLQSEGAAVIRIGPYRARN
jgi:hypothetical protein